MPIKKIVSNVLTFTAYPFLSRERDITNLQFKLVNKNCEELTYDSKLFFNVISNCIQSVIETFSYITMPGKLCVTMSNNSRQVLEKIITADMPIMALTGHFGNWEMLALAGRKNEITITTAAKKANNFFIQSLISTIREKIGIKTIWREKDKKNNVDQVLEALKPGCIFATLIDQDTRVKSIFSNFFGIPAKTPVTAVKIGLEKNCIFIAVFLVRQKENFEMILEEISHNNEKEIINNYQSVLEQVITKNPEQWVWFHKRWRSQDNGQVLSSAQYIDWLMKQVS